MSHTRDHIPGGEHVQSDSLGVGGFAYDENGDELECAISLDLTGAAPVIRIHGMMDEVAEPFLRERLYQTTESLSMRNLILDFTYCQYVSESSLGLLLSLKYRLEGTGGQLRLSHPNGRVLRKFRITNLDRIFTLIP